MITKRKNIVLQEKHQRPILADVFYNDTKEPKPIIIFCHGYKGFKDWGAWGLVADAFAKEGFFFVKFNFSYNGGTVEQPVDFPDLEAFGKNNYIKELDDLKSVMDWVTSSDFDFKKQVNTTRIILIGHSRGGGITILKAAEDTRVTRLITWAGVSDYKTRFPQGEAFESWKKNGVYYVLNGRTKQQMPHYFQFYTSFTENEERLTISKAVKNVKIPFLIIHGTADPTVNSKEAAKLHQWNPRSELFLVPEADHVFGTKHPWADIEPPKYLRTIIKKTIEFAIH